MFMTALRLKKDGKPFLKLNIHEFKEVDISFLDSLEIDAVDADAPEVRYKLIYNQEDFLATRATILERYDAEEIGPRVYLEMK